MQDCKRLEAYQLAHQSAVDVHTMSLDLPKFEMYEEGSQIRRAANAIPANIVEGFGRRRHQQEYGRFLIYSHSSCQESLEHLDLLFDTKSLRDEALFQQPRGNADLPGRKLNRLVHAVLG